MVGVCWLGGRLFGSFFLMGAVDSQAGGDEFSCVVLIAATERKGPLLRRSLLFV